MAAARSLFVNLTRNKIVPFRSFASTSEAASIHQEPISKSVLEEEFSEKDDLRTRIFRLNLPKRSATNVLQNWVREGHQITISELRSISKDLRKSHRYKHALEISEWMISHDEYELSDSDYSVRINLMTRVFGIDAAERYFEVLPPSVKTSETYTALLHSYAGLKLIEKAEELYERIKVANISLTAITYNELMTLYVSVGQLVKVPSIVEDLKSHNVVPDLYTYNLWVSSCAASLNIDEVRKILEEMTSHSCCDENWDRYANLVKIYIASTGLVNSGLNSVVESDKDTTQRELITYDFLVILYGALKDKDRLDQIWKSLRMTRQKMTGRNYACVLSSYLMLEHLKEIGEIIDQWKQSSTSEFDASMCSKLVESFKEVGLMNKATSFQTILGEKGF